MKKTASLGKWPKLAANSERPLEVTPEVFVGLARCAGRVPTCPGEGPSPSRSTNSRHAMNMTLEVCSLHCRSPPVKIEKQVTDRLAYGSVRNCLKTGQRKHLTNFDAPGNAGHASGTHRSRVDDCRTPGSIRRLLWAMSRDTIAPTSKEPAL